MTNTQLRIFDEIVILTDQEGILAAIDQLCKMSGEYKAHDIEVVLKKLLAIWKEEFDESM